MRGWKRKHGSYRRSAGQGGLLVVREHKTTKGKWVAKYKSPNGQWNTIGKMFGSCGEAIDKAEKHMRLR